MISERFLRSRRRVTEAALLCAAAAAVLFGPVLVGALNAFPFAAVAGLLLLLCVHAFSPLNKSVLPKRVGLAALSASFAVTVCDLGARAVLYYALDDTPKGQFIRPWRPLPQVLRYTPRVRFEGEVYGDLAQLSGRREWREYKQTQFVTDAHGFRNDPPPDGRETPAPDLILLGDSFGAPRSTKQEETLCALLAREHGWKTYNLSVSASSPWQEYVNLLVEADRLRAGEGAVVLWLIFTGNDLDERYYPYFEASQLPWRGRLGQLKDSIDGFRYRSPLRIIFEQRRQPLGGPSEVIEKSFVDGRRLLFLKQYARNKDLTANEVRQHPNFELLGATFGAMKRLADERRLSVAVVSVPSKEEVYAWALEGRPAWSTGGEPSALSAALAEMARRHGMPFLDLKPALVGASRRAFEDSGQLLWWHDDTHWNPLGQQLAADTIQRELLLPLRK